jgi:8-oxo-dGTP diphosphatase
MRPVEVAAGLVFREGKLLITRRHEDTHLGGLWEFPGGKRNPGESFKACLRRELREELGIEVQGLDWVESITHVYPEKTVHLRFFRCLWKRHEPQALGCPAFQWVQANELDRFPFPAADARLLTRIKRESGWWV